MATSYADRILGGFLKYYPSIQLDPKHVTTIRSLLAPEKMHDLFRYAFEEGLVEVVKYLYLVERVPYDQELLVYRPVSGQGLLMEISDRQQRIIYFLSDMKKYSQILRKDGHHFYQFVARYHSMIESLL